MSNSRTIAKNFGWYGFETIVSSVVALVSSIAINRYLGPSKNSYIVYISYIASLVSSLGGMGIPATTRKYMAEFIGMGDRGTARYIFLRTLLLQAGLATLATGGFLYWVLGDAGADYKLASALLVLSIWPSMVNSIAAQANTATEDLSTNLPASVISAIVYFFAIAATVVFHWGVVGVGAALLFMRTVDLLVRFFPTLKRILAWETTHPHPPGLHNRMMAFAWPSIASMAVSLIVWGRSEIILLKGLCPDIRQVSFYSLAFTMAEQLLLAATIFGTAAATTTFVQYGRDKSKLPALTASTFRYLALVSIPLHFIAASLAVPALLLVYGRQFQDAAMVVALAPLLCIFKAFIAPAQSLLQSSERQSYVIGATVLAGIVDISVAWYFIPAHGAVGACIGNGTAQALAVLLMWAAASHLYKIKLPWVQFAKIVFISIAASLTAHFIAVQLTPLPAILCGGIASLLVLFGLFYLMRVLEREDHGRLKILADMMPIQIVKRACKLVSLLTRSVPTGIGAVGALEASASQSLAQTSADAQHQERLQGPPRKKGNNPTDRSASISVVIPAYNAASFLPSCLQSVFAQTLQPREVIVVDDGSSDNTAALARELGATVITRPNGGPSAARNAGIRSASSEWIALLDVDDLWAPKKLERQAACVGPETVLVYTGVQVFDDKGIRGEQSAIDPATVRRMLRYRNPIVTSSVLMRRETALAIGGFREEVLACEDWDLWARLEPTGKVESVPEPLTHYYVYAQSLSTDPARMLDGFYHIIDTTLLAGLHGFERWAWRRRILATQLCSAALTARDNGIKGEFSYILSSIWTWPSPAWEPRRLAILAASARFASRPRRQGMRMQSPASEHHK